MVRTQNPFHQMPQCLGKPVDIRMSVDSNNMGGKQTWCSHSGFLIYINTTLVDWYSKQQATIEMGVFGADFVAMTTGVDTLRGLRYKLRRIGVAIEGATMSIGTTWESTMTKKSSTVCYNAVRESVAMGETLTAHIPGAENPADIMTKALLGSKQQYHVCNLMHDFHDNDLHPYPVSYWAQVFASVLLKSNL